MIEKNRGNTANGILSFCHSVTRETGEIPRRRNFFTYSEQAGRRMRPGHRRPAHRRAGGDPIGQVIGDQLIVVPVEIPSARSSATSSSSCRWRSHRPGHRRPGGEVIAVLVARSSSCRWRSHRRGHRRPGGEVIVVPVEIPSARSSPSWWRGHRRAGGDPIGQVIVVLVEKLSARSSSSSWKSHQRGHRRGHLEQTERRKRPLFSASSDMESARCFGWHFSHFFPTFGKIGPFKVGLNPCNFLAFRKL
jgi:hypothetical protein